MPRKKVVKKSSKKSKDLKCDCSDSCDCKSSKSCSGGCGYFLGFLGAAVYYISTATGFWMGFLGVLKALVWPAFLIYEILKFVGA